LTSTGSGISDLTNATNIPRQGARFDRYNIDVAVLITAFAAGISALIGLKLFDFPTWLPAIVTAVVIAIYAIITYKTQSARLEPDQIGDNAYYLGFVFTLTSLGYTIYELDPGAGGAALREVISGFGVALSSTIVGVATRVILLQYRIDLTAREREVRIQLNDAAREFHAELADATRSTKLVGSEIRQHLEEHHKEVSIVHEKRTEAMVEELIGQFKHAFAEITQLGNETNKQLAASARTAVEEAEKAAGRSLETVAHHIDETSATFKSAMEALVENSQQVFASSSDVYTQNMADHQRMLRESTVAITTSSEEIGTVMERFAHRARTAFEEGEKVAERSVETVGNHVEEISATFKSTLEALIEDIRQAHATSAGAYAQNLVDQQRMLQESTVAITASGEGLKAVLEQFATQGREMVDAMARAQSETSQFHEEAMRDSAERLGAATDTFVETVAVHLAEFEKQGRPNQELDSAPTQPKSFWSRWRGQTNGTE